MFHVLEGGAGVGGAVNHFCYSHQRSKYNSDMSPIFINHLYYFFNMLLNHNKSHGKIWLVQTTQIQKKLIVWSKVLLLLKLCFLGCHSDTLSGQQTSHRYKLYLLPYITQKFVPTVRKNKNSRIHFHKHKQTD